MVLLPEKEKTKKRGKESAYIKEVYTVLFTI